MLGGSHIASGDGSIVEQGDLSYGMHVQYCGINILMPTNLLTPLGWNYLHSPSSKGGAEAWGYWNVSLLLYFT